MPPLFLRLHILHIDHPVHLRVTILIDLLGGVALAPPRIKLLERVVLSVVVILLVTHDGWVLVENILAVLLSDGVHVHLCGDHLHLICCFYLFLDPVQKGLVVLYYIFLLGLRLINQFLDKVEAL